VEPVRVHQHLELDDVLAFGMGAVDLVLLGAGVLIAAWLYVRLGGPVVVRLTICLPAVGGGVLMGPARIGATSVREHALSAVAYLGRPRLRVYQGDPCA
jgi:hypothetical protein